MTIYARRGKRGRTWYYDFIVDGKRYAKRVGPDRKMAQDAETVARAAALEGRYEREWGLRRRSAMNPPVRSSSRPSSVA